LFVFYIYLTASRKSANQSIVIKNKFNKDTVFIKDNLTDLPLLLFEAKLPQNEYFIILFSGDGGWRGFIDLLGKTLAQNGTNVVGWNAIPYFDNEKKPVQIAKDVKRVYHNFSHTWKTKKIILCGYSFSGEIIPFVYNVLDTGFQKNIIKVFLIGPSSLADFKASMIYYYNPKNSKKVWPELDRIPDEKVIILCDGQPESICKSIPANRQYEMIKVDYDHRFIGKFTIVANLISDKLKICFPLEQKK
jgi:type IV secretory pathway VirJ component